MTKVKCYVSVQVTYLLDKSNKKKKIMPSGPKGGDRPAF